MNKVLVVMYVWSGTISDSVICWPFFHSVEESLDL